MALLRIQHPPWRKFDISAEQDPNFVPYGADLHQDRPPSYSVPPPSYDDVYTDVPPDYTGTDALACAKTLCTSPYAHATRTDKSVPMAFPEKPDQAIDLGALRALGIDWNNTLIREHISKKQKKAQKAAQNVCGSQDCHIRKLTRK